MEIELRTASENDGDFVYQVKKKALGPWIERKWGWHEDYQRKVHDLDWQEKPWSIICRDGVPVGTLSVDRRQKTIRLSGFYLLPEYLNQGIGSQVLEKVLYHCDRNQRDCGISLRNGNRALSLFQRHGFRVIDKNELHTTLLRNWRVP